MFGEVILKGGHWHVRCEPHVRARLKRVFARAPTEAAHVISISNTPENCRDLEWFLGRYPMEIRHIDVLVDGAVQHRDQENQVRELLGQRAPPLNIPLAEPARAYQIESAQLLEIKGGLLNGDDVGLGKTVTAICSLAITDNLPAAVVCPPHMLGHWKGFIGRFAPALKVKLVKAPGANALLKAGIAPAKQGRLPDVFVISYFRLRTWSEQLAGMVRTVIFDECQQLRRPNSNIYRACEHVASKARRRLGLSATPIFNYGSEFFWVVDTLLPGALGTRDEFVREWCKAQGGDKARIADTEQFGAYLRREGIMLRRTRAEVGRELEPLSKIVHEIEADSAVLDSMTSDAAKLAQIILSSSERFRGEKMRASGEFDALMRQATGIAKAPYVAEFVRMLLESGERVVLFGWHRAVYSIWLEQLKEFKPVLYTGSESPTQKDESIKAFTEGTTSLFIMSLRSGAGVDGLQFICRTVVFGELDWSPGVHEQCVGRVYRDGQPDPVVAYFMVSDDGADPIMAEVLGVKREQIEGVRNPGQVLLERIDHGENTIRELAREFLKRRGITAREPEPTDAEVVS